MRSLHFSVQPQSPASSLIESSFRVQLLQSPASESSFRVQLQSMRVLVTPKRSRRAPSAFNLNRDSRLHPDCNLTSLDCIQIAIWHPTTASRLQSVIPRLPFRRASRRTPLPTPSICLSPSTCSRCQRLSGELEPQHADIHFSDNPSGAASTEALPPQCLAESALHPSYWPLP